MIIFLPSKFLLDEAYKYVSQFVSAKTAKTYKAAISIRGQYGSKSQLRYHSATRIAFSLLVYLVKEKSLKSATISVYCSAFRMLHLMKDHYSPEL